MNSQTLTRVVGAAHSPNSSPLLIFASSLTPLRSAMTIGRLHRAHRRAQHKLHKLHSVKEGTKSRRALVPRHAPDTASKKKSGKEHELLRRIAKAVRRALGGFLFNATTLMNGKLALVLRPRVSKEVEKTIQTMMDRHRDFTCLIANGEIERPSHLLKYSLYATSEKLGRNTIIQGIVECLKQCMHSFVFGVKAPSVELEAQVYAVQTREDEPKQRNESPVEFSVRNAKERTCYSAFHCFDEKPLATRLFVKKHQKANVVIDPNSYIELDSDEVSSSTVRLVRVAVGLVTGGKRNFYALKRETCEDVLKRLKDLYEWEETPPSHSTHSGP